MATHTYTTEQFVEQAQLWRGVDPEHACSRCGGAGTRAYGDTSTYRGGVGGQMITNGPCDKCWGSGDEHRPWPSHRMIDGMRQEIERLRRTSGEHEHSEPMEARMAEHISITLATNNDSCLTVDRMYDAKGVQVFDPTECHMVDAEGETERIVEPGEVITMRVRKTEAWER